MRYEQTTNYTVRGSKKSRQSVMERFLKAVESGTICQDALLPSLEKEFEIFVNFETEMNLNKVLNSIGNFVDKETGSITLLHFPTP